MIKANLGLKSVLLFSALDSYEGLQKRKKNSKNDFDLAATIAILRYYSLKLLS